MVVAPAAPPAPVITEAPGLDGAKTLPNDKQGAGAEGDYMTGVDANGNVFRFKQTTYYSCVTQGAYSHCGWHRPILEVSSGSWAVDAAGGAGVAAKAAAAASSAAVAIAWLLYG